MHGYIGNVFNFLPVLLSSPQFNELQMQRLVFICLYLKKKVKRTFGLKNVDSCLKTLSTE